MCNHGDEPEAQILLTSCQKKPATWNPSMQVTLGYLDLNKDDVNERRPLGDIPYQLCAKRGLYDSLEESCREVTCEDGQQLVSGMCKPMFLTARGLGYELYFGLRPVVPIDVSGDHDILHRLPAEMEIYLGQTLLKGKVKLQDFAMSFNTTNQDGWCSQLSNDLGVYARIISNTWNDQEQLQTELLSLRHTRFNIDSQNWNMSFQSFPSETAWHTMQPSRRHTPLALSSCVVIVANSHMEHRKDGTMRVGTTTSDPLMANENNLIPSYIRLSSLLTCPHVQLLPHEYSVAEPADDLMLSWGVVLHSNSYLMNLQGNVTICMSDFLHKLDKYSSKRSPTEETLAIVLLSISVLSLFVSFLVFLLFTVLRSLPGKNNMILVVCLFYLRCRC
uniref:Uncharacterized protein n=1 Tax=Arion vulgaris TaxID=1028688 RepID=A0A0B7A9Q7_9EUPU